MKSRLALLFICLPLAILAQSKNEKFLNKAEASYNIGDYSKAFKSLEKFRKKVNKKLGTPNVYTPVYYLANAKYNLMSGMIQNFESNVQSALTSIGQSTEKSEAHAGIIIDAASLYGFSGSYKKSRELLDQAKSYMDAAGFTKDPLKAKWDIAYAEALSGQGYYKEALDILTERKPYFAGRAVKQEAYVDDKGNLKTRRLSDEEYRARVGENSRVMTLTAITLGRQGDDLAAMSAFEDASNWIRKSLNRFEEEYIANQFYYSKFFIDNGAKELKSFVDLGDMLGNIKANHKSTHHLAMQIQEEYIRWLLRTESSRYYNVKLEYEKLVNKSFPRNSIYGVRLKAVEFDSKLTRDKTKGLEDSANNLLTNNPNLPANSPIRADLYEFLANVAISDKKFSNAETYLTNVINIKTELLGGDAPETHLARLQLANYYIDYTNNIAAAAKLYEDSYKKVVLKEIADKHSDHLNILSHLAILSELTDRYAEASEALKKAKEIAALKYDPTDVEYGKVLTSIARLEIKIGQYDEATTDVAAALKNLEEFRKDDKNKVFLVNAIETQAVLFGIKGLFDDAEDALDRSEKIINRSDNLIGIDPLATAREMSTLFIQLGRYAETEKILKNLIAEYEKQYGNSSIRLIEPLVNLGRLTLLKGDYPEADKIAARANDIAVKVYGEVSTKTAPVQRLLSDIDYQIGDYDKAEDNIAKALKSQEKQFGRNHIEVAKCLSQLALIKFYKNDNKKEVEKIMLESREIMGAKLGKDNPQYADILKNVAILYISEKRFDIAFSSLTQAESIWRTKTGRKNNINAASIYALTGDVFYQQKNYVKAEEFYNKGKDLYEKFFSRNHPEYVRVLSKLAKVYYLQKDYKRAKRNIEEALTNYESFIKQYFPALSDREKTKYWNTIKPDFEFYNTLAFSQLEDFRDLTGKVYNYQLLTKALLLSSSIKVRERILNSKDEALINLYNSWIEKKEFLTSAMSMSTQQLADNNINTEQLTSEVEGMEKQLSEKSELFSQSFENKKVTYENVQKSIGKSDVAVEIIRYRNFNHTLTDSVIYVALYVKADNARPKAIILPEGHRMESRWMRYYRNCITGKLPDEFSYKIFWDPIQKAIGQYTTVYLSPDGVYNQINLEAIPAPDGKYIIDDSNIVIVSNTKDLYIRKLKSQTSTAAKTKTNAATMFGNPTFYLTASTERTVTPLPGTEKEVQELDQMLKGKGWQTEEYLEGEATEDRVKALVNPPVLHIATHGFYTPEVDPTDLESLTQSEAMLTENPLMKTGLLLRGAGDVFTKTKYNYNIESGILTAYEAMNLNLDKTDLVVLSACETGLGDVHFGEGVYGLQRAFLAAGAKVLIMSMFKVDDEATQKLISNFYKKWSDGGDLRQSFIAAKKELRTEYPDPYYWGTFIMIGMD